MGVAALVLGIVALVLSLIPLIGVFAFLFFIPGVLLGIIPIVWSGKEKKLAIVGLVFCVIAGGISILQANIAMEVMGNFCKKQKCVETNTAMAPEVPSIMKERKNPEVLQLSSFYMSDVVKLHILEFTNLTDKEILAFRGNLVFYDIFEKPKNREQIVLQHRLPPHKKLFLEVLGDRTVFGNHQYVIRDLDCRSYAVPNETTPKVSFECIDVKYADEN